MISVDIEASKARRPLRLARFAPTGPRLLALVCVAIAGWLVLAPMAGLFITAFSQNTAYGPGAPTLDNFVEAYGGWHLGRLLWNSFVFAASSSVMTLAVGAVVAWTVERTDMPGREIFHNMTLLSFALPGLLTTMAWALTLSPNIGWLNELLMKAFGLKSAPFNLYTMGGMVWALSAHYFPLVYLLLGPAFRLLDVKMEEAALVSGASRFQVLARVTFPLLRPALLSALLLMFVRGIESFEIPQIVGMPAKIDVFTTDIELAVNSSIPQFGIAGALSMTLLAICVLIVYLYRRALPDAEAFATITGKGFKPTRIELGAWRWPTTAAMILLFVVVFGLPLFTLTWQSLFVDISQPFTNSGGPVSLSNYIFVLSYPVFLQAVKTSVGLGVMAATAVVILTMLMAWIAQRARSRLKWLIDVLAFAPIAIPGIIVGASVLLVYLLLPIPVYETIWILLLAYMTLFLPYGMRFASGGLAQIHRELEESALMCGAGQIQTFRRVLIPLLAPAAVSAWIYVFVLAVRELGASIMLVGPGTGVLGTVSLTMWDEGGSYGAVCALAMIQILPLIVIVAGLRIFERWLSGPGRRSSAQPTQEGVLRPA